GDRRDHGRPDRDRHVAPRAGAPSARRGAGAPHEEGAVLVSCVEFRELLHAYGDGELDLVPHAQVEAHVADCAECSSELEGVLALREAIVRSALSFEPPPSLERAVRRTLRRAERGASRRRAFAALAALAAALLAGVLLG